MNDKLYSARSEQASIARSVRLQGIGLHSGVEVNMTLHPAEPGTGIVFRRSDLPEADSIVPATLDHVVGNQMSTTIGNAQGATITTIEHLMAAFAGLGLDNIVVELDGPEVPAVDGSAAPFVRLIERAEIILQDAPRRMIKLLKPIMVGDGTTMLSLSPADTFSVDFSIDFASPAIARQSKAVELVNGAFVDDIASARTFGFAADVEALREAGLARGGSLENAVVIDEGRVLNPEGLRFEDEFVRHKILDCMGDLYLAGGPILAAAKAVRSGHAMNHEALRAMFADPAAWCFWDPAPVRSAYVQAAASTA